jgi:hypothetical protein
MAETFSSFSFISTESRTATGVYKFLLLVMLVRVLLATDKPFPFSGIYAASLSWDSCLVFHFDDGEGNFRDQIALIAV